MKRFTRVVGQVGLRAAIGRVIRRLRVELADRRESAMIAASFRRASRIRASAAPISLRAQSDPLFSIVISPLDCSVTALASTLRSIERETTLPYEVLIDARSVMTDVRRYLDRCRGLLDACAALPRGRYRLDIAAGVALTRRWDRRVVQTFTFHSAADRVAFALRRCDGGRVDGLGANYIIPVHSTESPCVAVRVGAVEGEMLCDPLAAAVVPNGLAISYEAVERPSILVMDSFVPRPDRDAGSRRMLAILELLRNLGYHVIFVPQEGGEQRAEAALARARGIDVRVHEGEALHAIERVGSAIDVVWLARPEIVSTFLPLMRERFAAPVIYDTVDLHHLRLEGEERVCGRPTNWREMRDLELFLAREATVTVVTSVYEQRVLAGAGIGAELLSIVEEPATNLAPLRERHGLLYVGNFTHAPNRDAADVLVHEILPLVRKRMPNVRLTIAGFDPERWARRYVGRGVRVLGYVEHLERHLENARVFVAPLRFGAGAKGKIVQSLAHGLPVVTTQAGAEGLELHDGVDVLIREPGPAFADAVVALLNDDARWQEMSAATHRSADRFSPAVARDALAATLARARGAPPARA